MRTLFLKLFFWFWLAMILSGLVFFLFAFNMRLGPVHAEFKRRFDSERRRMATQALLLFGRTAAGNFERSGQIGEPGFPPDEQGMRVFLFSDSGERLTAGTPPHLRNSVMRFVAAGGDSFFDENSSTIAVKVMSHGGRTYVAATEGLPPPPKPPPPFGRRDGFPFPPDFWFRFLISAVVGGIVCYGLTWHLTSPVRRLREAAQRLARGELSARVPLKEGPGDEIADLGRDFNGMAETIEKLLTARKQLVRDVSHELRSPLARLNVALGLARREASEASTAALDMIEKESGRLNEMIGELLTLSMLESGDLIPEMREIDLCGLLSEVIRDAGFEAAGSGKTVDWDAPPRVALEGNGEMLRRAVENVVRNAIRYTFPGTSVGVTIEAGPSTVSVRVRDHGPGIPQEYLSDIFRPFFRVEEDRDRKTGSTGIGLAITEQTVKAHGGKISASNAIGGGLEVEIVLPRSTTKGWETGAGFVLK